MRRRNSGADRFRGVSERRELKSLENPGFFARLRGKKAFKVTDSHKRIADRVIESYRASGQLYDSELNPVITRAELIKEMAEYVQDLGEEEGVDKFFNQYRFHLRKIKTTAGELSNPTDLLSLEEQANEKLINSSPIPTEPVVDEDYARKREELTASEEKINGFFSDSQAYKVSYDAKLESIVKGVLKLEKIADTRLRDSKVYELAISAANMHSKLSQLSEGELHSLVNQSVEKVVYETDRKELITNNKRTYQDIISRAEVRLGHRFSIKEEKDVIDRLVAKARMSYNKKGYTLNGRDIKTLRGIISEAMNDRLPFEPKPSAYGFEEPQTAYEPTPPAPTSPKVVDLAEERESRRTYSKLRGAVAAGVLLAAGALGVHQLRNQEPVRPSPAPSLEVAVETPYDTVKMPLSTNLSPSAKLPPRLIPIVEPPVEVAPVEEKTPYNPLRPLVDRFSGEAKPKERPSYNPFKPVRDFFSGTGNFLANIVPGIQSVRNSYTDPKPVNLDNPLKLKNIFGVASWLNNNYERSSRR